jgi:16S rRNA (cytosine967-C5)-methyltransferase
MKPCAHLQAVIEILVDIEERSHVPADQVCADYYKTRRYIGSTDRRQLSAMVYGVLRHRASCDWWALRRGLSPHQLSALKAARVRLLAYLWCFEKMPRADLGIHFSGEKYAPTKLDDRERKLFSVDVDEIPDPAWVQGEYPEWMQPLLKDLYGDQLHEVMQAYQQEAPVDLRVNTLKIDRDELQKKLQQEGIETQPLPSSPLALRCAKRYPLSQSRSFKEGLFEVQDEGSQLLAAMVDIQPGEAVLDFCAGAGGKTLALAAQMQNKGRLVATDIAEWRLKRAKERMKRAEVHNVECRTLESLNDKWLKRQKEKFDKVLVDAPCSGTGTWRRNPDQKWRMKKADLFELPQLQGQILTAASRLVKPGGCLIYATCSFMREENEDIVNAFLEEMTQFELEGDFQRLSPHTTHTDGFFAATLKKKNDEDQKSSESFL